MSGARYVPSWLSIAESYIGLKEIRGVGHNPTILGWLKRHALNIGRWGKGRDETPWCAVFVSHCLSAAGYAATNSALASSYLTYGSPGKFRSGDIIVLKYKRKGGEASTGSRAGYHVGFLNRVTKTHVLVTSGNHKNRVDRSWYPKARWTIEAVRTPAPVPHGPLGAGTETTAATPAE